MSAHKKTRFVRQEREEWRSKLKFIRESVKEQTSQQLMDRRTNIHIRLSLLKAERDQLSVESGIISDELKGRDTIPAGTVDISDHAIIRYLERVKGFDIKSIRKTIRTAIPDNAKRGESFIVDGVAYVISDHGRVTTVYEVVNTDD